VASVKRIRQIEVSAQPLCSLWNTQQHVMQADAYPDKRLVTTQVVKSAWELAPGAALPYKQRVESTGRAWSGVAGVNASRRDREAPGRHSLTRTSPASSRLQLDSLRAGARSSA
jgi:hypothetical protein